MIRKLLEEATKGELYVVKEHDLWCAIYRGHGLNKRLVADCIRDGDAALIVYLVNHAAAFAELVEAAREYDDARGKMHTADWARVESPSGNTLFDECLNDRGIDMFYKVRAALRRVEG